MYFSKDPEMTDFFRPQVIFYSHGNCAIKLTFTWQKACQSIMAFRDFSIECLSILVLSGLLYTAKNERLIEIEILVYT